MSKDTGITYKKDAAYILFTGIGNYKDNGNGTHTCIENGSVEQHTYAYSEETGTEHTRTCTLCGYKDVENHNIANAIQKVIVAAKGVRGCTQYVCPDCGYLFNTDNYIDNYYSDISNHKNYDSGVAAPHEKSSTVDTVEADGITPGYTIYHCDGCYHDFREYSREYYHIDMGDGYGDGWNNAYIEIYEGLSLKGTVSMNSGHTSDAYVSKNSNISMVWRKGIDNGEFDSECSIDIHDDEGTQIYSSSGMNNVADYTVLIGNSDLFSKEAADYTELTSVLNGITSDKIYESTLTSIIPVINYVSKIDMSLNEDNQSTVDQYAADMKALVESIVEETQSNNGKIDMRKGNLIISATGYKQGDMTDEIAYTGDYYLYGTDTLIENQLLKTGVTITGGNHNITLVNMNIGGMETGGNDYSAFDIQKGNINLTFYGQNTIYTNTSCGAGICVGEEATIVCTENSTGMLYAAAKDGAGIGSNAKKQQEK